MEIRRIKCLGFYEYPNFIKEVNTKPFYDFIGSLSQLSMLNISGSNLTSEFLRALIKLLVEKPLRCLILDNNNITEPENEVNVIADNILKTNIEHLSGGNTPLNWLYDKLINDPA